MGCCRVAAYVALGVALTALTAGCGVPDDGWIAVGRANDGSFRVYLRTCTHPVDGATLYWPDDPNGDNSNEEVFADWTIAATADGPTAIDWPLLGAAGGTVTAQRALRAVPQPPKNLALYAWTRDNTTSADGPFQVGASDLDRLKPGQLLVPNDTGSDDDPPNKAITREAFSQLDCP